MRYSDRPRHLAQTIFVLSLTAMALLTACAEEPPAQTAASPPPPAESPQQNEGSGTPSPTTDRPAIIALGAVFDVPEGWSLETPSSQMRLAQARIPGSGGDAELTVFFFGPGGGGGLEANLSRWVGQVDAESEPHRESFILGDWTVTWIDVAGVLKPSTMGTGPSEPQPGSRLLGAVVEGEGGPWFFKATGPAATLDEEREAFLRMLKSGRPHP